MMLKPKFDDYSINALVALGKMAFDDITYEQIKLSITKKIINNDVPIFYLINKFKNTSGILMEAYAKVIIMKLVEDDYYIDNSLIDTILDVLSLDDLVNYGRNAVSLMIQEMSKSKFDEIAKTIENKEELYRKINLDKVKIRTVLRKKQRVIENDKYKGK